MRIEFEKQDIEMLTKEILEGIKRSIHSNREDDQDKIFDCGDLAIYLGVKVSWVRTHIVSSTIPFFKVGKYIRFRQSSIDEWIRRQTIEPINS